MTADSAPPSPSPSRREPGTGQSPPAAPARTGAGEFAEVQQSPQFGELRRAHRAFAFPLTVAFVLWYLLYVLLSNYAEGFMGTKVAGNVNVALVLGLAQFLTTFLIAWWYARRAATALDPKATALRERLEGGV